MELFVAALAFILGSAIGSFLSVVIYRLHSKQSGILFSRSMCPACKKQLKWRYLVPVLSWLFLRGKCGYCGKKISVHYFALEVVTGLAFVVSFLFWNFIVAIPSTVNPSFLNYDIDWFVFGGFLSYIIEFSFLIAIFFYDLMYKEIPDHFSIPAIVIGLAAGLVFNPAAIWSMLLGAAILLGFFLIQFLISKGKWIGGGDLRLGILMGILLGWDKGLVALVIAYLIGAAIGILLLITKRAKKETPVPLGPFLITGTIISLFYGDFLLNWYLNITIF